MRLETPDIAWENIMYLIMFAVGFSHEVFFSMVS